MRFVVHPSRETGLLFASIQTPGNHKCLPQTPELTGSDAAGDDDKGGKRERFCGLGSAACFVTGRWNENMRRHEGVLGVIVPVWLSMQLCNRVVF